MHPKSGCGAGFPEVGQLEETRRPCRPSRGQPGSSLVLMETHVNSVEFWEKSLKIFESPDVNAGLAGIRLIYFHNFKSQSGAFFTIYDTCSNLASTTYSLNIRDVWYIVVVVHTVHNNTHTVRMYIITVPCTCH